MSQAATEVLRIWRHEPWTFARENFGIELDLWQTDAVHTLKPEGINRLCMKACAGPGKSVVLAIIGWWMLACFAEPGECPKGAAVSITGDNLRDNLWAEMAKWQKRSAYLSRAFTWQKERIYCNSSPEDWFLSARSFAKTANAEELGKTLSGLHSRFPFVLLDETGGMHPALGRAAEQAMGNCKCGTIAQAGNPTSLDGLLYHSSVTDRANWSQIEITADPDDPKRTPRVSADWAREQIRLYGRDNPWVMGLILGKFPPAALNALLGSEEVLAAIGRNHREDAYSFAAKVLGIDVARFGDDRSCIFPRQGVVAFDPIIMRNARTTEIAGRVAEMATGRLWPQWKADGILVDGTGGYGGGVIDNLVAANLSPIEVQFAGRPNDPRFFNKRSEIWWLMAEWIKSSGALPNIPDLVRELTAPTYWMQGDKLRLEEKEQIKARLGWSPDIADALACTFAQAIMPATATRAQQVVAGSHTQAITANRQNYDPQRRR